MSLPTVGSVWTVAGVRDGIALVIAGPFGAPKAAKEFLVAPLYTGSEPGFSWTNWDVLVRHDESPFDVLRYAAVWNVRPVLEYDLELQLGDVNSLAVSAIRDVYWASLNGQSLGPDPRLGRPLTGWKSKEAGFQKAELERWKIVSGRVIVAAQEEEASEGSALRRQHWAALENITVSFQVGGINLTDSLHAVYFKAVPSEVHDYLLFAPNLQVADHGMVRLHIQTTTSHAVRPLIYPIIDPRLLPVQHVPLSSVETLERESNRLTSILLSLEAA